MHDSPPGGGHHHFGEVGDGRILAHRPQEQLPRPLNKIARRDLDVRRRDPLNDVLDGQAVGFEQGDLSIVFPSGFFTADQFS